MFDVAKRRWDAATVESLGLSMALLPEVREAGEVVGNVSRAAAASTDLVPGLPVCVPLGDNQASFLGSVKDRENSVLVNVGTGAQVAAFTDRFVHAPPLETRPFPRGGNLLVHAGLCGGRSYAVLEAFFRTVGEQVLQITTGTPLYDIMNRLAYSVPSGAGGLRCKPLFTGSRQDPTLRASWTGVSPENFTPAHMTRSLLEGIAAELADSHSLIRAAAGKTYRQLIGAGNGLRQNSVLAAMVAEAFAMPLRFPRHCEEAAVGAALTAGLDVGRPS